MTAVQKTTSYDDALKAAIAGEYAAIYAYGVLGSHLAGPARSLAAQADQAHRNVRDALLDQISDPPEPDVAYAMPFPVKDLASSIALAVAVEEKCAALWRAVVTAADPPARPRPLAELTAAAQRAAGFRRMGGALPGTVAFPGR